MTLEESSDLQRDAPRVLQELLPFERRIKLCSDDLLVRIRAHRTAEDDIDGVVVRFVNPIDGGVADS